MHYAIRMNIYVFKFSRQSTCYAIFVLEYSIEYGTPTLDMYHSDINILKYKTELKNI